MAVSLHGSDEGFVEAQDGTRIYWSAVGRGAPALVCCDGIGCDGFAWKYVVRDFAARHRIVRWHYRGHGRSAVPGDLAR
ncbi:MAG: alpha/beta fold hydrolase, partial [Myxococcales bacterium]